MNIFKRAALVALAILLVFASLSIGASAEGETGNIGITISTDADTYYYPGEIVTVTLNISTNYKCTGMRWPVMFSTKLFELVTIDEDNPGNVQAYGSLAVAGSSLTSTDATGDTKVHVSPTYTQANFYCLLIQWLGQSNNGRLNYYYEPTGANCITFQLRIKDVPTGSTGDTTSGDIIIVTTGTAAATYKSLFYYQGTSDPENAVVYVMEQSALTVTCTPKKVYCYKTAAALKPRVNTDTILDKAHGYIYGLTPVVTNVQANQHWITTESDVAYFVSTEGGARYDVTPNALGGCSTGAVITVYDARENLIGTYTIVVFGDINGDENIDDYDTSQILEASMGGPDYTSSGEPWDNAEYLACDVTGDGAVTADDYGVAVYADADYGYIGQKHTTTNFFIY